MNDYLGKYTVELETSSDIERRMLSRTYELGTMAVIVRLIKPGQCVLDIGANVGAVTLALAKAVGPSGRVDAIEPGPPTFAKLVKNLQLNPPLSYVHAHQIGLSDSAGTLLWQESVSDPGNASLHWVDHSKPTTQVSVTTIDAFVTENELPAIHFLKIDVEGMELKVLKGGMETIRKHCPAIFFETSLCDDEQRATAQEIEQILAGIGYRLYKVHDSGAIEATRYPDLTFETLALADGHEMRDTAD